MKENISRRCSRTFSAIVNYKTNSILKTLLVIISVDETPNEQDVIKRIKEMSGDVNIEIVDFYILN